ncbi:MAG: hypothetical protein ACJASQ_004148 [Crocinitomicaceae bacterium]|jgi:hypothetical protein
MNQTINLVGKWSVSASTNGPGSFEFKDDNTGIYMLDNEPVKFYWWQKGNSFWMQKQLSEAGWLEIFEGNLTPNNTGSGKIIAAEQVNGSIYLVDFTMTKK